jgi:hypothetical protein
MPLHPRKLLHGGSDVTALEDHIALVTTMTALGTDPSWVFGSVASSL